MIIKGVVGKGSGVASQLAEAALKERREASGAELVAGTLNVAVSDLPSVLERLPEPEFLTDHDADRGALRWWRVFVCFPDLSGASYPSFLVRHEQTRTRYLEVMSETRFRSLNIQNGDAVELHLAPGR